MIDVESQIYTPIAEALRGAFPGISVSGEYVPAPSKFPYVSIVEQDNYTTEAHMDSSEQERFTTLMYEVNVYSNKSPGKKSVCRSVMNSTDEPTATTARVFAPRFSVDTDTSFVPSYTA